MSPLGMLVRSGLSVLANDLATVASGSKKPSETKIARAVRTGMIAVEVVKTEATNLKDNIKAIRDASGAIKHALPTVKIVASHAVFLANFNAFIGAAGVVAQFIQVYQGQQVITELRNIRQELAVQTALDAPEKFAKQVYKYVAMKAAETAGAQPRHFYFLYHPDTDWHPTFFELVENKPLPDSFYGMSENLDALCVWMRFVRVMLAKQRSWGREAVFVLLVPAYRPFHIQEPLDFAEVLHPLIIHGMIHNNEPFVRLNLPKQRKDLLDGVGLWERPPGPGGLLQLFQAKPAQKELRFLGDVSAEADEIAANGFRKVRRTKKKTKAIEDVPKLEFERAPSAKRH
ncbi:hypothetical protein EJ06DRAFT_532085 [Trichodelitschia bisporula]|uniref:Uncharacterized protein n=1 Tax=Trichodelitschia bisporula TaxID=703511 RepID=A0A6G1HQK3_9PEZI|nr:hypothetical protein EJ06DRAFT_532085 [Trichodelitschia bisporula]